MYGTYLVFSEEGALWLDGLPKDVVLHSTAEVLHHGCYGDIAS